MKLFIRYLNSKEGKKNDDAASSNDSTVVSARHDPAYRHVTEDGNAVTTTLDFPHEEERDRRIHYATTKNIMAKSKKKILRQFTRNRPCCCESS